MRHDITTYGHLAARCRIVLLFMLLATTPLLRAQLAVGHWRDHLSYTTLYKVCAAGDRIYASAAGGLFYYDLDDMTLNRLNKTTSLNDVGISTFAYDPQTRCLVIAYNNANIDIVKDDKVTNLSDIKRSNISGSKSINNIRFHNNCAYLACGFGIVVVDLRRNEIKETYYIGDDGTYININDIAFTDSLIVAATDNGIMSADIDNPLLNIVNNWSHDTTSLLAGERITSLAVAGGKLIALADGSGGTTLYNETQGLGFLPWISDTVTSVKYSNNRIIVCLNNRIELYDSDLLLRNTVGTVDWMRMEPNDAELTADNRLWVAHQWAALATMRLEDPDGTLTIHRPQSPESDNVYRMVSYDNNLMVCPGGHSNTYAGIYLPANIYTYSNNQWHQLVDDDGLLNNLSDVVDVAVNPRDPRTMTAAVWGHGLIEIHDNQVVAHYDENNSNGILEPYSEGSFSTLITGGVAYDLRGNVWVTNSSQRNGLVVRYADGNWNSFNTLSMVNGSGIDHILCDSIGGLKVFWGRANRIFVHDGDSLMAWINPNNGAKLETSTVNCVVQDHNGNLWIGTNKGIKVVYDLQRVFRNGGHGEESPVSCSNILFSENGITEYLMAYENISCIAVDGANRKWVGTATGGLYLLSANGLEQLEHFTTSNSPLFSDKVTTLSIMPWSGELFIGSDKGIQSYRTTATYAYDIPQEDIHAFPNPMRPDYDGPIAIKGFTRNGLVHITDANGNTVYSTRSNGGQAIWNGRTNKGTRVASGVYYVFASAEDGTMRSVTKILIIR